MLSHKFCQGFFLKAGLVSLISLISLLGASSSHAVTIENGSFETGDFTGWQTLGRAFIETAEYGVSPTEQAHMARLDTICPALENLECKQDGNIIELAEFLNLGDISALENLVDQEVFEGSAIKTMITVNAGDVLQFDWNFLTNVTEDSQSPFYNDFAFFTLSETADKLADTYSPLVESLTDFRRETGFKTYQYTFTTSGTYTLSFGVADVGDGAIESGLLLDNIRLSRASTSTSIPEPTTTLSLLSLGALGVGRRLLRQRSN